MEEDLLPSEESITRRMKGKPKGKKKKPTAAPTTNEWWGPTIPA